jgi:hypothetical protein
VQNFALGVVFHIPWRAHNQMHKFAIWFEDADAKQMQMRMEGQFEASQAQGMKTGDSSVVPMALNVSGFVLEKPGDYAAVLEMDGTEVSRWRFRAVQVVSMPVAQRPAEGPPPAADGPAEA